MSNSLAISAVTSALRNLLEQVKEPLPFDPVGDSELADATCTTKTLDRARGSEAANQLNLFLYQTTPNAALRNLPMPGTLRPGESAEAPLAVNLSYLITAYGKDQDEVLAHRLLGRAMSLLHDSSVFGPQQLRDALVGNDVDQQIERVRISPQGLSAEEISKLWTAFQTPYRLTVAYQVSVVLINSARPARAPLPVLSRGISVPTGVLPPYPTLETAVLPRVKQPSALLNEKLVLTGHHLTGDSTELVFVHPLTTPANLPPSSTSDSRLEVTLPNNEDDWPAGIYSLSALVKKAGQADRRSAALPLALAPRLQALVPSPATLVGGKVTLTATVSPKVWAKQRVVLLLGDREIPAKAHPTKTASLEFVVKNVPPGTYHTRVRVDGIDSHVIKYDATPPAYDDSKKLVIQ